MKTQSEFFGRVSKIASQMSGKSFSAEDVRTIMKAWRADYQDRKAAEYEEFKVWKEAKGNRS